MAIYQNILVAIDPNQDDQPALRRAAYLVQRNGGCIKAFLSIYDLSYDMTTLLSPEDRSLMRKSVVNHRSAWISELCRPYTDIKIPIEIKVVWHNRPYEAIIQEILNAKHDLLLKMAHQHSRLESLIFTPVDWHLLRKCPCPVWIVKDKPWPENAKTVVAVNLSSGEKAWHQALNLKLVEKAQELVKYIGNTEIHIISAYPVMPINISIEIADFNSNLYNDAIRAQHLIAIKSLRQKFSMDEKYTHVEKGLPEQVIPSLSEQLQAGIVILGTLGRTGISAAMMGNTAENVIDRLKCDLLVIKPDEFVCPVECDMD